MRKTTAKDVSGQRFGSLTALCPTEKRVGNSVVWKFMCDCGNVTESYLGGVSSGRNTCCRNCVITKLKSNNTKHGRTGSKEYLVWQNMKRRCLDDSNKSYSNYGGRGISVCPEWEQSFDNFIKDVGNMPEDENLWSLERIDVNGNYCKENCKWMVVSLQARNRRKQKNNSSGKTGVALDGNRYKARWYDLNNKLHSKSFSILKYGKDQAFTLACEYRDKMIEELNLSGAEYGKYHGQ
jgi:hypothetical protein